MQNKLEDSIHIYLSGNLSEEEELDFENEIQSSPQLSESFDAYKKVWQLTNQLNYDSGASETEVSWHNFETQMKAPKRILGFDWLKIAASITILVAFSISLWFFGSTNISFASKDEIRNLQLVDNTNVVLDRNSVVQYAKNFGTENREVTLNGQAYFDVAKDKLPFIVHTSNGDIKVLGTKFNVFSYENIGFLLIELEEGSIAYTNNSEKLVLKPGDRLVSHNGVVNLSTFSKISTWDNDRISCSNVPMAYILNQLELVYNVKYKVTNRLLKEHYTVSLPKDNLSECIRILNDVSGKSFALIDGTIALQ